MLQNYLITALRNFTRHKLYSFINIAGLTMGLTCAIFIILFVRDQLSYDRWIPDTQNLYRVEHVFSFPGQQPQPGSQTPWIAPQAMFDQIPEVKARLRLIRYPVTVLAGDHQFSETVDVVDPNFFQVIKLPLISGTPTSVFAEPDSIVLSETMVRKYFGRQNPLRKLVTISAQYCDQFGQNCQSQRRSLVITGVLRNLPHNTQLQADLVMPNTSKADPTNPFTKTSWLDIEGWGYVLLARDASPDRVVAKLKAIIDRSVDPLKLGGSRMRGSEILIPRLNPFRDDHLSTDQYSSMTPAGSWTTVYGFIAIGILILMVACFNFTNLATARAMIRAREVSLRKVAGAKRYQLMVQFLGESVLVAMISLILALALSELLMPVFDRFSNAPIVFHYFESWPLLLLIVCIGIAVGLLSGIYPALVLSGFRPATALRPVSRSGPGWFRTSLVVFQFAVSIGLGIAILVISAQVDFARNIDLGFRKDGVVLLNANGISLSAREALVEDLKLSPDIAAAAISDFSSVPFAGSSNYVGVKGPGRSDLQHFRGNSAGPGFAQVFGIHLHSGRLLSPEHGGDVVTKIEQRGSQTFIPPYNVLINETGARRLGFSATSVIGKTITVDDTQATVVGVIGDIKMAGANAIIEPSLFRYFPDFSAQVSVRIRAGRLPEAMSYIDRTWHAVAPSAAIERHFLDDDYNRQFLADEKQGNIFGLFVAIAIFIASLGLFGLAAFLTERRTKEIGLRKTFGARTRDIILMLLWQFSIPVLAANLIAWPVAYYYLRGWLDGYAYRISLNPLYFVGTGAAALLIAWATVIVHAAHVAKANPIHALRHE